MIGSAIGFSASVLGGGAGYYKAFFSKSGSSVGVAVALTGLALSLGTGISFLLNATEHADLSSRISKEVIDARIGRLQSKIRFLDQQLQTELPALEREQINRGKDYFSLNLNKITTERLAKITVETLNQVKMKVRHV